MQAAGGLNFQNGLLSSTIYQQDAHTQTHTHIYIYKYIYIYTYITRSFTISFGVIRRNKGTLKHAVVSFITFSGYVLADPPSILIDTF